MGAQMDLLQLGPRGDLVVGSAELLVSSLTSRGTVVHWFDLRAFNQGVGAQLCCVLRYLSGAPGVEGGLEAQGREAEGRS